MTQEPILQSILRETDDRVRRGEGQIVVFDLDSTLFEVTPRSQRILNEFIESEHLEPHGEMKEALRRVKLILSDHGLESAVRRAGVEFHNEELKNKLIEFWRERFFSDDYLETDMPFEGAVDYVRDLYNLGAHIYYLTGRDKVRMGVGTPRQLLRWQFPLEVDRAELIMKPVKGIDDSLFKVEQLRRLNQVNWFFENEPKIIRHVEQELPSVNIIFFESSHSGKAEPKTEWRRIQHFKRY